MPVFPLSVACGLEHKSFARFFTMHRGNLSVRTLAIVLVLAAIGLTRGFQASAQGITNSVNAYLVSYATLSDDEITNRCLRIAGNRANFEDCVDELYAFRDKATALLKVQTQSKGLSLPTAPAFKGRVEANSISPFATSSTFTPTLKSSVPSLPFLGNWLTGLSYVPNATTAANATAAYAVDLARLSDCSLAEGYTLPGAGLPQAEDLTSLTGAQDYFHQLAGLTTTPDVFANGCKPQTLGLAASNTGEILGQTSSGAAIGAQLADAGLYVVVTDLTANTSKATQVTSGSNPGAFYAASLRNNGIMDLVETGLTDAANSQPATAVLIGNGDGTFKTPVYYDVSANSYSTAAGFTVDDVNGDGIPDIVVLNGNPGVNTGTYVQFSGTVTTLIGKGDGTFTIGKTSSLTWSDSLQVVTGIFKTGDQKDLLVGGTVLFGAGDGSFTQGPTNAALAVANENTAAVGSNAVGSLRNNGKADVVVAVAGFVSIFYGNGDGTFQTGPSYAGLADYMPATITDIDGDGNPDIFLGASSGGVYAQGGYDTPIPMFQILMGRGDGTFVDSRAYLQGSFGGDKQIASADFNGDSKPDVLIFNGSNGIGVSSLVMLPGDGTGALGTPVSSTVTVQPTLLIAAKMNHHTLADAIVAGNLNTNPQIAVLTNQGNGSFANETDYPIAAYPLSLVAGDFNGDGLEDIAVGTSMGVFALFGQSNGTLGTPVLVDSSANPTGLAAGSLTTDGRTDLVVADKTTGALHVYLGNADGSFTAKTAPTAGAANASLVALGDLNNDGKLDLVVAGFASGTLPNPNVAAVYTFIGNGDGTFQTANTLATDDIDAAPSSLAVADFNKDGNLDVVVGNVSDSTEILFGAGDGTLVESSLTLGQRAATVAAADLNGDGYPEFLVGQQNTENQGASLVVLQNQSTGWASALATPTVAVSPSPTSITTAQSSSVTVTVSGGSGNPTPTGSVVLSSGTYTSASTTLSGGSAVIAVAGSALAVASDTLTATYTPDSTSSTVYNGATGSNTVAVTTAPVPSFTLSNGGNITIPAGVTSGNTSTITASPTNGFTGIVNLSCAVTTVPVGATSPATCSVTSSINISGASPVNATVTVNTTSTTTPGAYAVTVTGTSGAITQPTIVGVTVTAPPSFGLSNSGNIAFATGATTGNTVTITATPSGGFTGTVNLSCTISVAPAGAANPATCSVTNSVGITGATAVNATLTVNTTSTTTTGAYTVKVTGVSGAISQTTLTGATITAFVSPPSFTLTNSGTVTLTHGATTGNTATITVTPSGGFTGSVALTAALTTSPTGASDLPTFSFGATTPVVISGATAGSGTLTVSTTPSTTGALVRPTVRGLPWYAAGGTALACLLLFGIPMQRRRWPSILGALMLLAFLVGGAASCSKGSSGNNGNPGTTAGSYSITVTGTSGSITQTTIVNLTVN